MVARKASQPLLALRFAVLQGKESKLLSQQADVTELMVARLLEKYDAKHYLDSTDGTDGMTAPMFAVAIRNHREMKRLLEAGAEPESLMERAKQRWTSQSSDTFAQRQPSNCRT